MVTIVVDCFSFKARCECILPLGHEGNHACDCGGEWDQDGHAQALPIAEGLYTRRMLMAEREGKTASTGDADVRDPA
jgi:hypothetical protein